MEKVFDVLAERDQHHGRLQGLIQRPRKSFVSAERKNEAESLRRVLIERDEADQDRPRISN
jgi:hypothetical protein